MDFQLEGKVALVTGGAEKAGRYFARSYAEAGADIVIAARRIETALETQKLIEQDGGQGGEHHAGAAEHGGGDGPHYGAERRLLLLYGRNL